MKEQTLSDLFHIVYRRGLSLLIITLFCIVSQHSFAEVQSDSSPFGINYDSFYHLKEEAAEAIADIGAEMIRWWVFWHKIEPQKGEFEWTRYDEEVKNLQRFNIEIIAVLSRTPEWAVSPFERDDDPWDGDVPQNVEDYTRFVRSMVERYKPGGILAQQEGWDKYGVTYWEIWNESDLNAFWAGTDEHYVELLKESYKTVKQIDQECKVLIGGLSGEPGLSGNIDISHALTRYYELGIKGYYDILNIHWYPKNMDPVNYNHTLHGITNRIAMVRKVMAQHGDETPIWNSEFGWGKDTDESLQSQFLVRFHVSQLALGIEKVLWFYLIDTFPPEDYGLVHRLKDPKFGGGVPKLGYYTYKLMTSKLAGCDFSLAQKVIDTENVHAYKFLKKGQPIYVLWWDYWKKPDYQKGDTKTVTLDVEGSSAVIANAVPKYEKGADVLNYENAFEVKTLAVSKRKVSVKLGEDPVFLELVVPTDTLAPAKITDLAASDSQAHSINLTWTAPGDDDNAGTAASYDIRYSTAPIMEDNWAEAEECIGEPIPQTAGTKETFIVTGLQPGNTYYFAIKTQDESGNTSSISNVVSETTISKFVLTLSEGINLMSVPLAPSESWSLKDLASHIGPDVVMIVRYDESQFSAYSPESSKGPTGDALISPFEGYIVIMKASATVTFKGRAWGKKISVSLRKGINMISVPLAPKKKWRFSDLADHIGSDVIAVIGYDKTRGRFVAYLPEFPIDSPVNTSISGGEGYIVIMKAPATVTFTGTAWEN